MDNGLYRNLKMLAGEDTMFRELVNRRIYGAELSADGTKLSFVTRDGTFVYTAYADCCSQSWVESTDPLGELTGAVVLRIEQSQTQCVEGTKQEVDKVDFITFVTHKGYWKLEFRNSSNGYYGGSMELTSSPVMQVSDNA